MFQFTLQYSEAMKIAKKLTHSMGKEETRYYLMGFFVHKDSGGNHYAVSTDGHMLTRLKIHPVYGQPKDEAAVMQMPDKTPPFPAVIFPALAVKQIEQIKLGASQKAKATVSFQIDGMSYQIECDGQTSGGKLIDGNYPDYQRIIPDYSAFTNEYGMEGFSPIYLSTVMKAASYDAKDFKATPTPVRILFQAGYPGVVLESRDQDVLYIVMPMRGKFEEHRHPAQAEGEPEQAEAATAA